MSQDSVESFIGRIITDERFRNRARISLEQTCFSEGYPLSQAELEYLAKIDFKLISHISTTLDGAIRRH